jgi:hypothetical protein
MNSISFLIPIALGAFWIWMFWKMITNNRIHGKVRFYWLCGFIFLGAMAAGYYYVTQYRKH